MTYSIFQSTFPRGERPFYAYTVNSIRRISIHVPAWGTTKQRCEKQRGLYISIHVPAWGTTRVATAFCFVCCYFNPRSRVGNDLRAGASMLSTLGFQSTFPRGERPCTHLNSTLFLRFQSTFPRGERRFIPATRLIFVVFQSTFPRGERLANAVMLIPATPISIHVPAWGTTLTGVEEITYLSRFQSTFPRGERLNPYYRQRK